MKKEVKKQVAKSEQINSYQAMIVDYDQPLTTLESKERVLKKALGNNVKMVKFDSRKTVFKYDSNGISHYLIVATLTYLSKPHPIFKKRMQLQKWYKDFYAEHQKSNEKVHLIGLYHFDDMEIYCDFDVNSYINKKMHSSSAHVYTNDLYQAVKNGVFNKIDMNNNRITVIKGIEFKNYLDNSVPKKNDVIALIEKFNGTFDFNTWLKADVCIQAMKDGNWFQSEGVEWPGWFLEFKVDDYIQKAQCQAVMRYRGNNKTDGLDFDLFFGTLNFYGDLKASDIKKKEAPGNDKENTLKAISQYKRLWYIVYEHETIKDKDRNYEMSKARMKILHNDYKEGDHVSYKDRMKHSVNFKRMRIFELNEVNMHKLLSDFNQGHNSGKTMAKRAQKFLLKKENQNNSVIYTYEA